MNKNMVLIKNLLLSTSQWNIYKFCKDKKKRGKIVGNSIGMAVLVLMLLAYCIANCIGFVKYGLEDSIPTTCATIISSLAFFLTLFKTNGYLFNFKEYDMLMSLPYAPKNIAACKFIYMYIKSLPWNMAVSLSMMIVYGVYTKASILMYPVWIILSMFLPVIPMLIASFLGFLIAKAGSGFKNKNIVQTAFMVLLVLLCFGARFFLENMFRNNQTEAVMNSMSDLTGGMGKCYLPLEWFRAAVADMNMVSMLLIIAATVVLFIAVFIPVGRSYRKINSALKSHAAARDFDMKEQKTKSLLNTIAFKEFKRMTGSTTYMTNAAMGQILCVVAGIAVLFVDVNKLLSKALEGAPITAEMLRPAIPFIIYFFLGMVATTAISPSLEGKNYWIVQSLPIRKRTLYFGKMLFNLYFTVPFMLFATITFSISFKASVVETILYIIMGLILCVLSTCWGLICGLKHMRLDWENEIEIVKQSTAVAVYLFPNMLLSMAMIGLLVYLGTFMSSVIISVVLIAILAVITALCVLRVLALTKED